jgi:hypothetical protein
MGREWPGAVWLEIRSIWSMLLYRIARSSSAGTVEKNTYHRKTPRLIDMYADDSKVLTVSLVVIYRTRTY